MPQSPIDDHLELGASFAQGGMGVIVSAEQHSLGREVAVKLARSGGSSLAQRVLVGEALVTGGLEHPHIVPVYDLRDGPEGPQMVMKRVRGIEWSQLISDPHPHEDWFEGQDPLEFHLDVLMKVCRAVSFAHERGVLHRDIKASNVMVAPHGEVLLLDWGLAVAMRPGMDPRIRRREDVRAPEGSPGAMAPEMARGKGQDLGVHTDVYLLGALLHYILTGSWRHQGRTTAELIQVAQVSAPPEFDRAVPPDLARLVVQATAADPAHRPANPEQFRRALREYGVRQASRDLAEEAVERCGTVARRLARMTDGQEVPLASIRVPLTEGRFAVAQALASWPENQVARRAKHRLGELAVRHAVAEGNLSEARAELRALEHHDPALTDAVDALAQRLRQRDADLAELDQVKADADLGRYAWLRVLLGVGLGLLAFALCAVLGVLQRAGSIRLTYTAMITAFSAFTGTSILMMGVARALVPMNAATMRHLWVMVTLLVALNTHWAFAAWMDLPLYQAIAWNALISAGALGTTAVAVERGVLPAALAFLLTAPAILAAPAWAIELLGLGSGVSFALYTLGAGLSLRGSDTGPKPPD